MLKVTVAKKTLNHSSYNKGSKQAYVINGFDDYTLRLIIHQSMFS